MDTRLTLGSLFDGIGGFPLSAIRNNIEPIWASEIEKIPIAITSKFFPNMQHLGDVSLIDGTKIEPVDIISFGSPCQNMSISGKREGLNGEKSKLFLQAIRIIREMQKATNNRYPRYAIWENVLGAFSSNNRQDFKTVLEQITETEIPMPKSGKWANAGMVRGRGCSFAWRVLDSQYWGVPQRRRRIFLVADFRGQTASKILFNPLSMQRDITKSSKPNEKDTYYAKKSTRINHKSNNNLVVCIQSNCIDRADTAGCNGAGARENICYTLNTVDRHAVCYSFKSLGEYIKSTKSKTLLSCDDVTTADLIVDENNFAIRRLTPLECERLMGFPDNWTFGYSDNARYKALGNSIVIPCVEYILQNIVNEV